MRKAALVDLLERELEPLDLKPAPKGQKGTSVSFKTRAFEVKTVKLWLDSAASVEDWLHV